MLQRVFVFLLLLLVLPDVYLYYKYVARRTANCLLRAAYWLPTALLALGLLSLVGFGNHEHVVERPQAVGWFSVFFFLFSAPKLVLALCRLLAAPFHRWLRWPIRPFTVAGCVLAAGLVYIIIYGSFFGRTRFTVKEASFASASIPQAFDGYRIVQLSDIHIGSWKGNTEAIRTMVEKVNSLRPDLIVFTGDLVNHRANELDGFQEVLAALEAPDGVYSILGNHDYGPYYHWNSPQEQAANLEELKRREAAMGWRLLNNEHAMLKHNGDSIALIGVENDGEPPFSQYADLPRATQGIPPAMFRLLLSHNPTHWRREVLPETDIELMLAGHTHAMQLQIGHHSPASYFYPEWAGMYSEGARGLYVNVGIGFVGLPFRFGAWPEITVLTLHSGAGS